MAKSSSVKVGVPLQPQEEEFLRVPQIPLSLEDRIALRSMFASQAFKRAWHNAKQSEPGAFPIGDLNGALGAVIANNRLHQQQGWKLFEAALLKQCEDPAAKVPTAQERWSNLGVQIVDPANVPAPRLAKLSSEKSKTP